jgi:hypothetical protein
MHDCTRRGVDSQRCAGGLFGCSAAFLPCALYLTLRPQARASVAAMQAECTSLDAELASSQVAVAQLESLAAAAGAKENAATTATQLVVALTEFVPLLDTAEALAAQGTAACGAPALPDGVCFVSTQQSDGSHVTDARLLSSSPSPRRGVMARGHAGGGAGGCGGIQRTAAPAVNHAPGACFHPAHAPPTPLPTAQPLRTPARCVVGPFTL